MSSEIGKRWFYGSKTYPPSSGEDCSKKRSMTVRSFSYGWGHPATIIGMKEIP